MMSSPHPTSRPGPLGPVPEETAAEPTDLVSVVVFRLGDRWYALPGAAFQGIHNVRPIHAVPGRSSSLFLGLANIDGELLPCLSLAALLGHADRPPDTPEGGRRGFPRLVVLARAGDRFVAPVDEAKGLVSLPAATISPCVGPETTSVRDRLVRGQTSIAHLEVLVLDEEAVLTAFDRGLAA
jgi:chemotaxis-related protein WspD